jgi:hypothetical protein
MPFSIARAEPGQVEALCAIERKAVHLFRGHPAWTSYAALSMPPEQLVQAISRGLVWVALGEVLWQQGHKQDAQRVFDEVRKLDPHNDNLQQALKRLHP